MGRLEEESRNLAPLVLDAQGVGGVAYCRAAAQVSPPPFPPLSRDSYGFKTGDAQQEVVRTLSGVCVCVCVCVCVRW